MVAVRKTRSHLGLLSWLVPALTTLALLAGATAYAQGPGPTPGPPQGYLGPPQLISVPGDPSARPGPPVSLPPSSLPNVRVNDKVDDAPDQSQSETTIGVDATNPLRLIGGFNDCRGFFIPSRNGISGWGFSTDGGATWTGVQTGLPKASAADFG